MQSNWLTILLEALGQMSGWEVTAALTGVGYILLAAKESQWCWLFAFISTVIYTVLFWDGQLPMQALLNFYYMGMAVYGYWLWRKHGLQEDNLAISHLSALHQVIFTAVGIGLSVLITHYLTQNNYSQQPVLDASITVFSVMNTWLMAKKIIQNWVFWIVIDAAAALLYFKTGYYATTALFLLNTVLAVVGYFNWLKRYRAQQSTSH